MVKKILLILILLALMPTILAIDTVFDLTIPEGFEYNVTIIDHAHNKPEAEFIGTVNNSDHEVDFKYSCDVKDIRVEILVSEQGTTYMEESYGPFLAGADFKADLFAQLLMKGVIFPDGRLIEAGPVDTEELPPIILINETEETETEIEELEEEPEEEVEVEELAVNQTEEVGGFTGLAIGEQLKKIPTITYYIIAIVLVISLVVFLVVGKVKKGGFKLKRKKKDDVKIIPKDNRSAELKDAEERLKEAQEEIMKLKNQDKITEIEKRLEQDRRELERLRGS